MITRAKHKGVGSSMKSHVRKQEPRKMGKFEDTFVIYFSKTDDCWIGHSLKTDQIGTGDCVLDALVDATIAVKAAYDIAKNDSSIDFLRQAPQDIQEIAKRAKNLPKELAEIAYKRITGDWPEDTKVEVTTKKLATFTTKELISA